MYIVAYVEKGTNSKGAPVITLLEGPKLKWVIFKTRDIFLENIIEEDLQNNYEKLIIEKWNEAFAMHGENVVLLDGRDSAQIKAYNASIIPKEIPKDVYFKQINMSKNVCVQGELCFSINKQIELSIGQIGKIKARLEKKPFKKLNSEGTRSLEGVYIFNDNDYEFISKESADISEKANQPSSSQASPQYLAIAAALLTKGFVILGGVSGVGKTHMARTFSRRVVTAAGGNSVTIPVSPSWTDETSVTGYWNLFLKKWEEPEYLKLMKAASENTSKPYFAIFDEMNIARPEYYMPNLLSIMEIRGSEGANVNDGAIQIKKLEKPQNEDKLGSDKGEENLLNQSLLENGKLCDETVPLSSNMFIIGTANTDESTFNFSPKVIDRAFYFKYTADDIELVFPEENNDNTDGLRALASNFHNRMVELNEKTCSPRMQIQSYGDSWEKKLWSTLAEWLEKINKADADPDSPVAFGTRCINEMTAFIVNYIRLADDNPDNLECAEKSSYFNDAFDWAVRTKLLPKFSGNESQLEGKIAVLKDNICKKLGIDDPNDNTRASVRQARNVEDRIKKDGYYIY